MMLGRVGMGDDVLPSRSIQWSMCSIQNSATYSSTGPGDTVIIQ
jgi:hypothetical protein